MPQMRTLIATGILSLLSASVNAQTPPTLTILAPINDTTVQPGQPVQIIVGASAVNLLTSEAIVGTSPLGVSGLQPASLQTVFTLTVPAVLPPGRYHITAFAGLRAGGTIQSPPVSLRVPLADAVSSLTISPNPLILRSPGVSVPLDIIGTTARGRISLAGPDLSFESADPNIASVDSYGTVTAQRAGGTQITAKYQSSNGILLVVAAVQIAGGIRGDIDGNGQVDIDDVNRLSLRLNSAASGSNDARDLNHDGKIDALDARILATLCTYPRCATHP